MWEKDEEKTDVWALRAKIHNNITPDSYLWTRLSPERIPHSSKQQDSKVYSIRCMTLGLVESTTQQSQLKKIK